MTLNPSSRGTKRSPSAASTVRAALKKASIRSPTRRRRSSSRGTASSAASKPAASQPLPSAPPSTAAAVRAVPDHVVQRPEEQLVAHPGTQVSCVREQVFRLIEPGGGRLRMPGADVLGIVPENRRLHARRADHVVRDDQEAPAGGPCVGLRDGAGKLRCRTGARVAAQQQRQYRHEVALAAAEAAVQVRALAGIRSHRAADQRQRIVEAARELRRHHVVAQRLPGPLHPLRRAAARNRPDGHARGDRRRRRWWSRS